MSHLVSEQDWGVVDLDVDRRHVLVREDWRYDHWRLDTNPKLPVTPWTHKEKLNYHNAVDRLIWGFWSMRAKFKVEISARNATAGPTKVAVKLANTSLTSSFDVRRVHGPAHWTVTVTKVSPDNHPKPRAKAEIANRHLNLFSTDVIPVTAAHGNTPEDMNTAIAIVGKDRFRVAPHEFAHTIGYYSDEYKPTSPFFMDYHSLLNIGREMRPRHLALIVATLESLVPACRFNPVVD
jgi:hypothetical protein